MMKDPHDYSRFPRPGMSRHGRRWVAPAALAAVGVAVLLGVAVAGTTPSTTRAVGAPIETGEINSMGVPVIETPGAATGRAAAGDVEVTAAHWELGTVPLDTAVRPSWLLHNTGTYSVTVLQPHVEVLDGCCPGPLTIDRAVIPPGGKAELTFELAMHPGMDGWHDMGVHVPLRSATGDRTLTLSVTGDFR